ncbi:MAG: ABC transporter ATP-binding protein, partial [Hominimerdicola sp.]
DFSVKKGETVGIIGGTGSGKTSVINLIPRFYDPQQGQVLVSGVDVKKYPLKQLRGLIGIVPQKAVLFKGTIRDNMKWRNRNATDEEIIKALEIAQALEFVNEKPEKLDHMILQEGKNLSGGQRQRLTIARALVGNPEILIFDDSASALDLATDAKLRKAIAENTDHMTVFIVSQRISSIKNVDKIIVLDDGKIAGIGVHKELYKTCEVYKEICLSQLSEKEVSEL